MWQQELCDRLQRDNILPPSSILNLQTSRLLTLPAELRNRIYHYLFPAQDIFHIRQGHTSPPILRTCKKLRHEVSGLFYSNTILQFSDRSLLIHSLSFLDPDLISLIPELRYDTSEICTEATSWRSAFRELPGLDEDTKLQALRDALEEKGVTLRDGVLKARIRIGCRDVWTSDPLGEALGAVKRGSVVGRMMFV